MKENKLDTKENKLEAKDNKKKNTAKKIVILLVIAVLVFVFCWYENHHIVVTHYSINNEKITGDISGFKIVQISDFHNATFGGRDNASFVSKVSELEPDIIVLTGDLVDSNHANVDISLEMVRQIVNVAPVYYVTGNHEYWLSGEDKTKLFSGMEEVGVHILNNESATIEKGEDFFLLVGLDDKSLYDNTLAGLLEGHEELNVVLAHEPQYIKDYSRNGADIVMTGHAHGGQFILPLVGPVIAPDQGFFPQYTEGAFVEGTTTMIISRGLGNSVVPVRLFNDPEIVVITLE